MEEKLLFELSQSGNSATALPRLDPEIMIPLLPADISRRTDAELPEISEPELIRHFYRLSRQNFSVDTHFYPLGSCTMKYNPKVNEDMARLDGFAHVHPLLPAHKSQGLLQLMYELEAYLCALTGMSRFSLQPAAGAHGELTGMMLVKAYHASRDQGHRTKVIVPDSSHGTNPASAGIYGFRLVELQSNTRGRVNLSEMKKAVDTECACLMLTNPNTLGLFEDDILEIARIVHDKGGLLYYDGANMNALMGLCRPGDMGFDIVHLNLHKTFSTPHGGGGPGAGPVGVSSELIDFLPVPVINKKGDTYVFDHDLKHSIGKVKTFYGNIAVLIKAYCYIRIMGIDGLRQASKDAILNANYLKKKIDDFYTIAYDDFCMHEFVASTARFSHNDIHASDVAKRLLDFGFHSPTVSFPLIVKDALMIEPTETESKNTLDEFAAALNSIAKEALESPGILKDAPHTLDRSQCDEVKAARFPDLCYSVPANTNDDSGIKT
jgi:glycine dehydrogenase subunit 2